MNSSCFSSTSNPQRISAWVVAKRSISLCVLFFAKLDFDFFSFLIPFSFLDCFSWLSPFIFLFEFFLFESYSCFCSNFSLFDLLVLLIFFHFKLFLILTFVGSNSSSWFIRFKLYAHFSFLLCWDCFFLSSYYKGYSLCIFFCKSC